MNLRYSNMVIMLHAANIKSGDNHICHMNCICPDRRVVARRRLQPVKKNSFTFFFLKKTFGSLIMGYYNKYLNILHFQGMARLFPASPGYVSFL